MAQQLQESAEDMSNEENQAAAEAIKRSAQDLVDLSHAGEQSLAQGGGDDERAERQEDLKEGASRVIEDLLETGKDTPYLSPEATQQLGKAINALEQSRDAFAQGNPGRGKQAGESAGEAVVAEVPVRGAGHGVRLATLAGPQAGFVCGRSSPEETDILRVRCHGSTTRSAVDSGRMHSGDKLPVES